MTQKLWIGLVSGVFPKHSLRFHYNMYQYNRMHLSPIPNFNVLLGN